MNKRRIPLDIQFLLESILSESPDNVKISEYEAEELNKRGANITDGDLDWEDPEAIPFLIDHVAKVVVFCETHTHGRMENGLRKAALYSKDRLRFDEMYPEIQFSGCVGLKMEMIYPGIEIYFYGLSDNTREGVRQYLMKYRDRIKDLEIRGFGTKHASSLCGRLWMGGNAVSFWNEKEKINPYMNLMISFIRKLDMDQSKCVYEFIDSKKFYTYSELNKDVSGDEKLSPEEMQAKLAQKHIKKSKKDYDADFWEKHGKKAAKGFEYPAKADAAIPVLEQKIKLKDLIK